MKTFGDLIREAETKEDLGLEDFIISVKMEILEANTEQYEINLSTYDKYRGHLFTG